MHESQAKPTPISCIEMYRNDGIGSAEKALENETEQSWEIIDFIYFKAH